MSSPFAPLPAQPPADAVRRGNLLAETCPSREVLRHLTNRWGMLTLIALRTETLRFSALRRRIGGISERMLAQTLQDLEGDGFVNRMAREIVPPHVEYSLTPLGCEALERVSLLADWIETSLPRITRFRAGQRPA